MEIGLGAAALAFPVFESIKSGQSYMIVKQAEPDAERAQTGYGFFVDAAHMPKDCQALHLRLLFEYSRLIEWADFIGLSDEDQHAHYDITYKANRSEVYGVLNEVNTRVNTLKSIERSYSQEIEAGERVGQHLADPGGQGVQQHSAIDTNEREVFTKADRNTLKGLKQSLAATSNSAPRKHFKAVELMIRAAKAIKQILRRPRTLVWSAVDKSKFTSELARLSELTQFLCDSMGHAVQKHMLKSLQDSYLAVLDVADDVTMIKTALQSIQAAPPMSGLMERLTVFKIQHQKISVTQQFDSSLLELDARKISVSYDQDAEKETSSLRNIATIDATHVWVEWKRYREIDEPAPKTTLRVQQLTSLLRTPQMPAEFRVPPCRGYILDEAHGRFGFVYDFAVPSIARAPNGAVPLSLHDLLEMTPWSFPGRFQAAQNLASSLIYLHAAGWLHKDLRSANVVILGNHNQQEGSSSVYISGFEYARPEEGYTSTMPGDDENIYFHPDYRLQDHGYKRSYDFYSLGIILLELAYWQTASAIPGILPDSETSSQLLRSPQYRHVDGRQPTVRDCILHDTRVLDGVRHSMGGKYTQAVETCIKGVEILGMEPNFDETDKSVGDLLQQAFIRLVVDNLSSIAF